MCSIIILYKLLNDWSSLNCKTNGHSGLLQVYFDVRVDNEPKGRITIQLYSDVPIGAQRFLELAEGRDGVSYRLSKIDGIAEVRPSLWGADFGS